MEIRSIPAAVPSPSNSHVQAMVGGTNTAFESTAPEGMKTIRLLLNDAPPAYDEIKQSPQQ